MIAFPSAKINLGLNVMEKRPDHFHNIETVLYPVPWCDVLEITGAEDFSFSQTGLKINDDEAAPNLCIRAYQLLKKDYPLPPVHIYLHKCIPAGAGLGGGSSDAAHTLLLLNEMFAPGLSLKKLAGYCEMLGSDCAFFLYSKPVLAKGKGEILSEISISLKGNFIVIVKPPVHVSTAEAYSKIKPKPAADFSLVNISQIPVNEWKHQLRNDFEETVFALHPIVKKIKEQLYSMGALYASMSGSGSAVFGIFDKRMDPSNQFPGCILWQDQLV